MATADYTIVTEARRLVNAEKGANLTADYPTVFGKQDPCGVISFVKSSSNVSTNYKQTCATRLVTDLFRLSAKTTSALESLPEFTPGAGNLSKDYIPSNLQSLLTMVLGGSLAPGFISRGPSFILPFAGTDDPEVVITGSYSTVVDVCGGDSGFKFNFTASQFAFTGDCSKFQRHSISLSGFKGIDYGASPAAGVEIFLTHASNNVPVGTLPVDTLGVTDASEIPGLQSQYDGIYNNLGGTVLTYGA